jgi:plasmid stabilization system protein ParE
VSPRYWLTPNAQENVDAICAFIADDSVNAALRVWGSLEQAFEQLAETPEVGHRREDLTNRPVKFWSVFSYLIVYDPTSVPRLIFRPRVNATPQSLSSGQLRASKPGGLRDMLRTSQDPQASAGRSTSS